MFVLKKKNCVKGDIDTGLCDLCKDNYYLDLSDRKCKSNKDDDEFIFCIIGNENECVNHMGSTYSQDRYQGCSAHSYRSCADRQCARSAYRNVALAIRLHSGHWRMS